MTTEAGHGRLDRQPCSIATHERRRAQAAIEPTETSISSVTMTRVMLERDDRRRHGEPAIAIETLDAVRKYWATSCLNEGADQEEEKEHLPATRGWQGGSSVGRRLAGALRRSAVRLFGPPSAPRASCRT